MRLIDIEAVLKAAELAGKEYVSIDLLKDLEQVDAVPVVRCGECIVPITDCPAGDAVMLKTDFCSYGKRKPERSEG